MSDQSPQHTTRRILLPSGRAIEVVRFDREHPVPAGLHVCTSCGSELVQPQEWCELPAGRWELSLRCPNCGWTHSGTFEREQVEQLEEHLDEGLVQMLEDLRRLTEVNMGQEAERFLTALRADLILPEDF